MKIEIRDLFGAIPFAILLLLSGCIDQISADLPPAPKMLVMNSILTSDSVFRVQVSRVSSTTDSSSRLLSGATVYLLMPGRSAELLRNQGNGMYDSPSRPATGVPYTLRAEADGYPAIAATDTLPPAVPIQEAWYSFPTGTDRNNELLGTVVVRFNDPAPTENFYEISANQGQDIVLNARGNAALAAEGDADFDAASLVFSDKLFNGKAFELRASFLPNGYSEGGVINGQPVGPSTRDVQLVLRTVSRSYYQYRKSWIRHLYNQGSKGLGSNLNQTLFLGDPIRMYSNVDGGYGVVVGYTGQFQTLPLR